VASKSRIEIINVKETRKSGRSVLRDHVDGVREPTTRTTSAGKIPETPPTHMEEGGAHPVEGKDLPEGMHGEKGKTAEEDNLSGDLTESNSLKKPHDKFRIFKILDGVEVQDEERDLANGGAESPTVGAAIGDASFAAKSTISQKIVPTDLALIKYLLMLVEEIFKDAWMTWQSNEV